ncbi:MAG: LemA family protein [Candidatus Diapherotrites archaeon]|nr:LemA family protein [Candidatus Diapherotrites archaeon]
MELILIGLIVVILVLIVAVILMYNSFVSMQKKVENAWAQIEVQLNRRADLIPNLIETVKGYAKFEKKTLQAVTEARAAIVNAKTPKESAQADNILSGALKSVFAVSEAYPDLKANQNFLKLQEEFSSTENKISYARQFYNDIVMRFNTAIAQFPGVIFAGIFGFREKEFFDAPEGKKEVVKADFSDL